MSVISVGLMAGCSGVQESPFYSATQPAYMKRGVTFAEGKIGAVQEAERKARDQVLLQAMNHTFPNGVTLEDAAVSDPFLRAKVYDIIRNAKISDQTLKREEGLVTVTVRLDMAPIYQVLKDPTYLPAPVAPVKDMPEREEEPEADAQPKVVIPE